MRKGVMVLAMVAGGLVLAGTGCTYDPATDRWSASPPAKDAGFHDPPPMEDTLAVQRYMREHGGKMPEQVPPQ